MSVAFSRWFSTVFLKKEATIRTTIKQRQTDSHAPITFLVILNKITFIGVKALAAFFYTMSKLEYMISLCSNRIIQYVYTLLQPANIDKG